MKELTLGSLSSIIGKVNKDGSKKTMHSVHALRLEVTKPKAKRSYRANFIQLLVRWKKGVEISPGLNVVARDTQTSSR